MSGKRSKRSRLLCIGDGSLREVVAERQVCPGCGVATDCAANLTGSSAPNAGAISICAYCAHLRMFTGEGLTTRAFTEQEEREVSADPGVQAVVAEAKRHPVTHQPERIVRHQAMCHICDWQEDWNVLEAAQAAAVWHVYGQHRDRWIATYGDRMPTDPLPASLGRFMP